MSTPSPRITAHELFVGPARHIARVIEAHPRALASAPVIAFTPQDPEDAPYTFSQQGLALTRWLQEQRVHGLAQGMGLEGDYEVTLGMVDLPGVPCFAALVVTLYVKSYPRDGHRHTWNVVIAPYDVDKP